MRKNRFRKEPHRLSAEEVIEVTAKSFRLSSDEIEDAITRGATSWNLAWRYEACMALFCCRRFCEGTDEEIALELGLPDPRGFNKADRFILHLARRRPWARRELWNLQRKLRSKGERSRDAR